MLTELVHIEANISSLCHKQKHSSPVTNFLTCFHTVRIQESGHLVDGTTYFLSLTTYTHLNLGIWVSCNLEPTVSYHITTWSYNLQDQHIVC